MARFNKVLVIQTAFIGDAILASAVLENVHAAFPEAEIHILVRKGNETLYTHHLFLKKVWTWDKGRHKFRNLFGLISMVRKERFDWLINLHRHTSSGLITVLSKAKKTCGFSKNPFSFLFTYRCRHTIGNGTHEIERNHQLLKRYIQFPVLKPTLYPAKADSEKIKEFQKNPYVCFAPASVWFTKQLPKDKWIELSNKLPHTLTVFLLGAKGDSVLCEEIKNGSANKNIVNLSGTLSFLESCALMSGAQMNYVNDSAPLHLASAVNAPVTAFFCSTIKEFGFYPLSDNSKIIESSPPPPCKPCGLHGFKTCPKGHFKCGKDIKIDSDFL